MMKLSVSIDQLKCWFCRGVTTGEHWVETDNGVCVFIGDICGHLATCRDQLFESARKTLGLSSTSTFADAVTLVQADLDRALDPTDEELAEQEEFNLKASAFFEQLNEENPDRPSLPVVYPKATRRRQ
jgi:hypothetical protein